MAREVPIKIAPISDAAAGGVIALGLLETKRVAFIADEDDASIRLVDLATRNEIGKTALPGRPSQLVIGPDGRLYVGLRDNAGVAALEAGPGPALREIARLTTPTEPVGLAITPDNQTLLVTSGWGRTLTAFSLPTGDRRFAVDLPREPRSVVVSEDGSKAFIAHAVGSAVSAVSLLDETHAKSFISLAGNDFSVSEGRCFVGCMLGGPDEGEHFSMPRGGCEVRRTRHDRASVQGFAIARVGKQILSPQALVEHATHAAPTAGYGGGQDNTFRPEEAVVAEIDDTTMKATLRTREDVWSASASRTRESRGALAHIAAPCLLPRAAVENPGRSSMLVACLGIDAVIEIGAGPVKLKEAEIARWKVPSGPMGIAVDAEARRAWVWSQFARSLSVIELGDETPRKPAPRATGAPLEAETVLRSTPLLGEEMELGRRLFHAVGDRRISADGRVCASCHPDGRDDGLVWSSPNGERQTPMLAGRLEASGPFGWNGDTKTVGEHLTHTFQRLGGKGLVDKELDALVGYALAMRGPAREEKPLEGVAARGKELFESQEVGCAVCHTRGGVGTDGSRHDVGSGAALDTPTLRFIAGTAPYFHDGRYATLGELLRATQGKMGWANGMTDADFDAIEAYLKTL
jgi:mono/diheme cytochrome c family protein